MIGTTWNNSEDGYGIRIEESDRDSFPKAGNSVFLILEGREGKVEVNINQSGVLISKEIKQWLKKNGKDTWSAHDPHKVKLEPFVKITFV